MTPNRPGHRASALTRAHARSREDGFTLVFFALSIIALMGIAALVVDLGYWYLHADRIQRAADSAALAGVVYLPGDPGDAIKEAKSVAAANGFSTGINVETQSMGDPSLSSTELKVSISDTNVPTFFAKVFGRDSISETRSSVATYQPPVPLGSAENSFGTGDLPLGPTGSPTAAPTNIWAAVNGYCTSKENGDEFLSAFDATFNGIGFDCPMPPNTITGGMNDPNATNNYEYNPAGYIYDIVTPDQTPNQAIGTPITVQAYDPSFNPGGCASGNESPDNAIGQSGSQITTTFNLYYAPEPINPPSGTPLSTYTATTGDQTTCGMWVTIGQIPASAKDGTYQLEVATQAAQANSEGTNAYGLRLYQGPATVPSPVADGDASSPWTRCTTDTNSPFYTAGTSCPVIQGQNALSVYVNSSSTTGSFYLANIDPSYDGKTLQISLFDPGEGDHYIQILGPGATGPVPFTYTTTDACSSTNPVFPPASSGNTTDCAGAGGIQFSSTPISGSSSDQGGETQVLDVSGTITPPAGEESDSEFNDRHLQLTAQIPTNSAGGWWKIVYYSTSSVSDRTTWSVSLLGSPIHLVPLG